MEGDVKFYEFSFTRETLAPILMQSPAGQRCLEMANQESRGSLEGGAIEHTRMDLNEFILSFFPFLEENASEMAEYTSVVDAAFAKVLGVEVGSTGQAIDRQGDDPEMIELWDKMFDAETFVGFKPREELEIFKLPYKYLKNEWNEYNSQEEKKYIQTKGGKKIINPNYVPTEKEEYVRRASKVKFMSADESVAWLDKNANNDKEYFELLQKYSRGYLQSKQFIVQQSTVTNKKVSKDRGSLIVGQEKTLKVLANMISEVNKKMFESFENMKGLSDNLQKFFLNNLETKYGEKAISAANKIEGRTKSLMDDSEPE